jgi:hypothetical protein
MNLFVFRPYANVLFLVLQRISAAQFLKLSCSDDSHQLLRNCVFQMHYTAVSENVTTTDKTLRKYSRDFTGTLSSLL